MVDGIPKVPGSADECDVMLEGVAENWTLNVEQSRTFGIVARHTVAEKPEWLLMYLGGLVELVNRG